VKEKADLDSGKYKRLLMFKGAVNGFAQMRLVLPFELFMFLLFPI